MPYCEANLAMDRQPAGMLDEYRKWQNEIVVPEICSVTTEAQALNLIRYGAAKMGIQK